MFSMLHAEKGDIENIRVAWGRGYISAGDSSLSLVGLVAGLVLIHWNQNGISWVCDLNAVFAIDHAPVELHSGWLHTAKPRHCLDASGEALVKTRSLKVYYGTGICFICLLCL